MRAPPPQVLNARSCDFEAVPDVMEMAVLSSVQHPNIVQVYCCLTNMVAADAGDEPTAPTHPPARTSCCARDQLGSVWAAPQPLQNAKLLAPHWLPAYGLTARMRHRRPPRSSP
jgi:hypothetical protein